MIDKLLIIAIMGACSNIRYSLHVTVTGEAPYPFYVSVSRPNTRNVLTLLVRNLLAYFLGDRVADITTEADCKKESKEVCLHCHVTLESTLANLDLRTGQNLIIV